MLLKLIKIQEMISGAHCEVWEVNSVLGDRLLAEVFVLNEHLPSELIYRLTVTQVGICIQGRHSGWQWPNGIAEEAVTDYLLSVQAFREEIRIEVCRPKPELPGYPEVDYHPDDYPIVLLDDLAEEERPEEPYEEEDDLDPEY
jgi:hypothetical protein